MKNGLFSVESGIISVLYFLDNFGSVDIGTILAALFIGSTVKMIHKIYYELMGGCGFKKDVDPVWISPISI